MNEVFKIWRKNMGLLQWEAAELIGISQGSYSRFEKYGIAGPKVEQAIRAYFKLNFNEFSGDDNNED